jgi:hypothetical protein
MEKRCDFFAKFTRNNPNLVFNNIIKILTISKRESYYNCRMVNRFSSFLSEAAIYEEATADKQLPNEFWDVWVPLYLAVYF